MSEFVLEVLGEDAEGQLLALRDWLEAEDALRGRLELRRGTPEPGHMGAALDVLTIVLGSGGAVTVFARSLTTWLTQRRADVRVTVVAADGRRVEADVRRAADPVRIIGEVAALLDDEQPQPEN